MDDPAKPRGGLGRATMFGAASQILSRGGRSLVGVATIAVLSRYLGPADFGIFALILFIVTFAQLFADFGLRIALLQLSEISELEKSSVFWFSMAIGLVMTISVYLASDLVAELFNEPGLGRYIEMTAPMFLIAAARGVPLTLLERNFQFGTIATSEIVAAIIGSLTAIAAVLAGYTVEALIAQQFVMTILLSVTNLRSARWLPRLRFSLAAIRPMLGFGLTLTANSAIGFLAGNIDRPILATRLSAADLGYFTVASQIVGAPIRTIAMNARRVTLPVLASIRDDNVRVAAAHRDSLHMTILVLAPICLGLSAVAEPFVALLLAPEWAIVGDLVGVSAVTALLWSVSEMNFAIFNAKGAVSFMLRWSILALATTLVITLLAAPYGLLAVLWVRLAWTIVSTGIHCWFLARLLEASMASVFLPLWRPTLAAGLMAGLVGALDWQLASWSIPAFPRLAAGVLCGVIAYAGLILLIDRTQVMATVRRVRSKAGPRI